MTNALVLLLPVVAGIALLQRRRLYAVIGMAVFSLLLAAVYLLAAAPDVAITEAAIGAALVTFIYVLALRKTGRLVVAASEVPGLIQREGDGISGLEWVILQRLAHAVGMDLVIRFVPHEEVGPMVLRGEADIAAGGLVASDIDQGVLVVPYPLPTARFRITGPASPGEQHAEPAGPPTGYFADLVDAVRSDEPVAVTLDLARFLALTRYDLSAYTVERMEGDLNYALLVSFGRVDLHAQLAELIDELDSTGRMERLIRRFVE